MNPTNDVKKSWALLREGFLSEVRATEDSRYIHAFYIVDRAIHDGYCNRVWMTDEDEKRLAEKDLKEEMNYGKQLEQKKIDVFPESPFGRLGGD